MKFLVEHGADVNAKGGYYNSTALMCASNNDHVEIVNYLVEANAKGEHNNNR